MAAPGDDGDRDMDALKSDGQTNATSDHFPGSAGFTGGKGDRAGLIPSAAVGDPNAPLADPRTSSFSDHFPGSDPGRPTKAGSAAGVPNPDIIGRGYGDTNVAPPGSVRKTTEGTAAYSSNGGALKDNKPQG